MFDKVKKNAYGYELIEKPNASMQKEDFEEHYYQQCQNNYETVYTDMEIQFFFNKAAQKEIALKRVWEQKSGKTRVLDVGCGEGFLLKYFHEKGYEVTGIDFSQYGITKQNPDLLPYFIQGDLYEVLDQLAAEAEAFDIVNIDSVLDMVQDAQKLLELVKKVLKPDGVLACKVGNSYSALQMHLLSDGTLKEEYWVDEKGHPWYFDKEGFLALLRDHGYQCEDLYSEGLAEFFLFHELTNYYENPKVGKACYKAKIRLENMMHQISAQQTNEVMRQLAKMGIGRELAGIFRLCAPKA